MANVARLDTKMRRQFVEAYFTKHPKATLDSANSELKKKFTMGMGSKGLQIAKTRALQHIADLKKKTAPLGATTAASNPLPSNNDQNLLTEIRATTKALATVMASPKCPVDRIEIRRNEHGKIEVVESLTRVVSETKTYTY